MQLRVEQYGGILDRILGRTPERLRKKGRERTEKTGVRGAPEKNPRAI
ncbi:MAG: hypothetical protein ACTSRA_00200 [Promethearchaeota archaeon]